MHGLNKVRTANNAIFDTYDCFHSRRGQLRTQNAS